MGIIVEIRFRVLVFLLAVFLSACDQASTDKYTGQAIARVNGEEITIHQLNFELSTLQVPLTDDRKEIEKSVLQRIINHRLLQQQAKKIQLDRKPEILRAIEHSKQEIITKAYVEKLAHSVGTPTMDEIKKFMGQNPGLYSKRGLFKFEELTVSSAAPTTELENRLRAAKKLDEVIDWLKSDKIPFRVGQLVKTSDQLPEIMLDKAYSMGIGEAAIFKAKDSISIYLLSERQVTPLTDEQSNELVSDLIRKKQIEETITKEINFLRENATIEYLGEIK